MYRPLEVLMLHARVTHSFTTAQNIYGPPNSVTKKDFWKENNFMVLSVFMNVGWQLAAHEPAVCTMWPRRPIATWLLSGILWPEELGQ